MKFKTYLQKFKLHDRRKIIKKIATELNVTEAAVRHWANGNRQISPQLALKLYYLTNKEISLFELRPDIYPDI